MFKNILTFGILFLTVIFLSNSASAAEQKLLQKIDFTTPEKGKDQIIFRLNGPHIPKIFAIQGERPRVVFDFVDTKPARLLKNTINTNGKFVQRIRMGIHYKPVAKTRIVLDLLQNEKINFDQQFDKQNNTLTISVFSAEKKADTLPVIQDDKKKSLPGLSGKEISKDTKKALKKKSTPSKETTQKPAQSLKKGTPVKQTEKTTQQPVKAPEKVTPLPEKKISKKHVPQKTVVKTAAGGKTNIKAQAAASPKNQIKENLQPVKNSNVKHPAKKSVVKKDVKPEKTKNKEAKKEKQAQPPAKVVPVLQSVSFDKKSNQGEMVLFRLNTFQAPIVFGVEEGEPRVVCDFKETDGGKNLQAKMEVHGKYIRSIRINKVKQPKKIRVVLDLAANKNYDLQQVFFKKENLFVLIINTQEKAATKVPLQIPPQ
jgi:hypothetical protein